MGNSKIGGLEDSEFFRFQPFLFRGWIFKKTPHEITDFTGF